LVWDNASWHGSAQVRTWIRAHNQQVKRTGVGVRIVTCPLPIKSPWLNPIEPTWIHGKRKVAEADRLLSADEMAERMHAVFGCPREAHLRIPDQAA
jgi:transposase